MKYLPPFFCRVGSKRPMLDDILKLIPPSLSLYVEPFAGGAALFWNIDFEKAILNDLDKGLIQAYSLIKKSSSNPSDYPIVEGIQNVQNFVDKNYTRNEDKLMKFLFLQCNVFGSLPGKTKIYKGVSHQRKLNNIQLYKDKLKNTTLLSQDYKKVIQKYDSPDTFFFLDPPYAKSKGLYKDDIIDYDELERILATIKGKFMLTLNDSPRFRKLFSKFNVKGISVRSPSNIEQFQRQRQELIITNYNTTNKMQGGKISTNPWIAHVQQYAKKNGMTYFQALRDPKVKQGYKKK